MLMKRDHKPHFIFASPNIPNPQVYIRMMTDIEAGDDNKLSISYSLVVQVKFLVDLKNREIQVYNEHNKNRIHIANIKQRNGRNARLTDILLKFESMNKDLPEKKGSRPSYISTAEIKPLMPQKSFRMLWVLLESRTISCLRSWRRTSGRKCMETISLQI